jgi:aspartate racemase
MASVGLVGGLGPESTIDYYRRLIDGWHAVAPDSAPAVIIDSLDVHRAVQLVQQDRAALTDYLVASIERLARAGVDFAAMTANTAHIVFEEVAARSPVPLLSIVEVCASEAARRGVTRLALLGSRFTMEAPFYPEVFARHGTVTVAPAEPDRTWVHDRYFAELLKGQFLDETRQGMVAVVERLRAAESIEAVILGGTELPLLLPDPEIAGLPALDTTALHVAAILDRLRGYEKI